MKQNLIVNVKLPSIFSMKVTSSIVASFEDVVDMVVHYSNFIEPFFCSQRGEFVVVVEVYSVWIKSIETSVGAEFVGSGRCCIVGKFCKR